VSGWTGANERKLLERVRKLCLAYPEATERLSHGSPCFYLRDKHTFIMCGDNHHGDGRVALWCAAPPGAQAALLAADPARFFVPAYVGKRGWVGMRIDGKPDWQQVAAVIDEAYHTVAEAHRRRA
jgi:predicted DNA-binding protein (MmcQ/YjbR family)